jgi:hypothetical protein
MKQSRHIQASILKRSLMLIFLCPSLLMAEQEPPHQHVSPNQIQAELDAAQAQFDHALKLFNPWYTGPLITPSASMTPPGSVMWQPYLFFIDTYAAFDENRKSITIPNRFQLQAIPVLVQTGITSTVDIQVIMSAVGNWSQDHQGGGFQDMSARIGFLIAKEQLYTPQAKFSIGQTFPTGKYNHLNSNGLGLDSTGAGSWQTNFSLTFGKVLFWDTLHPFNARLALGYTIATPVHVKNFNSYGGGFRTKGTVFPGNNFSADLGLELSISQPWVIALDVAYTFTNQTHFHGIHGVTSTGAPASVGGGYSDQLSLAPAIEYNFNDHNGLIAGAWFSVYGRNSSNFVSGIFSWCIVF